MKIEEVKEQLAADAELLTIEEVGEVVKVAFREFQFGEKGKETWNRVNSIVKELGGEWVSNGKLSHWKIPIKKEGVSTVKKNQNIIDAKQYLKHALENLEEAGY